MSIKNQTIKYETIEVIGKKFHAYKYTDNSRYIVYIFPELKQIYYLPFFHRNNIPIIPVKDKLA